MKRSRRLRGTFAQSGASGDCSKVTSWRRHADIAKPHTDPARVLHQAQGGRTIVGRVDFDTEVLQGLADQFTQVLLVFDHQYA